MTSSTLQKEIEEAVPSLLEMARGLTWNKISDHYKFIVTEIKDSLENAHIRRQFLKAENDKKTPLTLVELMPTLQNLYENLYDINLSIYKAKKYLTIIDIRYYAKSSLDTEYMQKVQSNPPMLHNKVAMPPWLSWPSDKKEKFDINWEHKQWLINWRLFWARQKHKHRNLLR